MLLLLMMTMMLANHLMTLTDCPTTSTPSLWRRTIAVCAPCHLPLWHGGRWHIPIIYSPCILYSTALLAHLPADLLAGKGSVWAVSGWGTTSDDAGSDGVGGFLPQVLQFGYVKYVDPQTCAKEMGADPTLMLW